MRKKLMYIIAVWTLIFIFRVQFFFFGIEFENHFCNHIIFWLSLLYLLIMPFLLIKNIKRKRLKDYLLIAYTLYATLMSLLLIIIGIMECLTIIGGHELRVVFEKKLSDENYFVIYYTDWSGTCGGSELYSVDKKLPFGLVQHKYLKRGDYIYLSDDKNYIDTIYYGKDIILLDSKKLSNKKFEKCD